MKRLVLTAFFVVFALSTPVLGQQVGDNINVLPWHPFDPNDPNDIAKYVTVLLEDKELRNKFGENSRKRVLKEFTWSKVAKDTLRVYEEIT